MNPELDQFLSSMKKTMEEVVIPNLTDSFAIEQAGIVAATLGYLETIHDKVFHYELFENSEYKNILLKILDIFAGDTDNDQLCAALARIKDHFAHDKPEDQTPLRSYKFIRGSNENMKEMLCELIQLQPGMDATARNEFEMLLKPFYQAIEKRERAWVKALGFDPEADQLPDVADILYQDDLLRFNPGSGA